MTSYRLLEQLLKMEQRVRQVYVVLSQHQQFPAELRTLWSVMAEDETHHIIALERSAHLLSVMDFPPSIVENVLANVETIITTAEASVQQPSLTSDEAFHQALLIEGSELNHINAAWMHGFRSTTRLLLETFVPEAHQHVRRLIEAAHRFSTDATVHAEANTLCSQYEKARE